MLASRQTTSDGKPFDASFGASDRYTQPHDEDAETWVRVTDEVCRGQILGRNGPRVQVRFERDGSRYVRWFDVTDLMTEDGTPAA